MSKPEKSPLGQYLESLRDQYTPPMSMRAAAELAKISEARWRQVENGYRVAAKDLRVNVPPPPDATIVQMVETIGGDPEGLREIGLGSAADMLERRMEKTGQDFTANSRMADLAVSLPDEVLVAEVVRRLLQSNPNYVEISSPGFMNSFIRWRVLSTVLRDPEVRDEDHRRHEQANRGPWLEYDPDHELRYIGDEVRKLRESTGDPSADFTDEQVDQLLAARRGRIQRSADAVAQEGAGEESQDPADFNE